MVRRQSSAHAVLLHRSRQHLRAHPVRAGVVRSGGCVVRGACAVGDRTRRCARADHHEPVAVRVLLHGRDRGGPVVRQRAAQRVAAGRGVDPRDSRDGDRGVEHRGVVRPRHRHGRGRIRGCRHGHRGPRCGAAAALRRRRDPARARDRLRGCLSDHGVPHDPRVLVSDVRPAAASPPPRTARRFRRSSCGRWNSSETRT